MIPFSNNHASNQASSRKDNSSNQKNKTHKEAMSRLVDFDDDIPF